MTDLHAQLAEIIEASMDNTNDMDVTFADFANAAATAILAEVKALFEPPSQAVVGVKVKPLKWVDCDDVDTKIFGCVCSAKTVLSGDDDYTIFHESGDLEDGSVIDDMAIRKFYFDDDAYFQSLDATKAAAQADYERRILSAIEGAGE